MKLSKLTSYLLYGCFLIFNGFVADFAFSTSETIYFNSVELIRLPAPELTTLEPAVATQLRQSENRLKQALSDKRTRQPELEKNYVTLGKLYHAYDLTLAAKVSYQNALKLNQNNFTATYLLARIEQQQGSYEQAIKYYLLAAKLNSRYFALWVNLGECYRKMSQLKSAQEAYYQARVFVPEAPSVFAGLGHVALANKEYPQAITYYKKALDKQPGANRLYYSLAMAVRGLGDNKLSRKYFSKSGKIGIKPYDPVYDNIKQLLRGERVQILRGRKAYLMGNYAKAVKSFSAAVEADPKSVRARINLSAALSQLKKYAEAESILLQAIELEPDSSTANYNIGQLLSFRGDYKAAIKYLQKAAETNPTDASIFLDLADNQKKLKQFVQALNNYNKATILDPQQARAWRGSAELLLRKGDYANAIKVLDLANKELPSDGLIAHTLARVLATSPKYSLRDGRRAVDLAQRVLKAQPTLGHADTLARAYGEFGDCKKAADLVQQMLDSIEEVKGEQNEMRTRYIALRKYYRQNNPCR